MIQDPYWQAAPSILFSAKMDLFFRGFAFCDFLLRDSGLWAGNKLAPSGRCRPFYPFAGRRLTERGT